MDDYIPEGASPFTACNDEPYMIHALPKLIDHNVGMVDEIEIVKHNDWKQQNKFRQQAHSRGLGFKGKGRTGR